MIKSKRAQEEIVGFALIIIIVSVILLFFLSFALRNSRNMEIQSYEVEGFIQAFLQHTSDCEDDLGFLSVQELIFSCGQDNEESCLDGENTCVVMESLLTEICENSWNVGENTPIKGYELRILSDEMDFLIDKGDITQNYKGAMQDFVKRGEDYEVSFKAYYD
jgi:hypothetical protein